MKVLSLKKFFPKYKMLMDNIQEMIIIFDWNGKIIDCNAPALKELGYEEDIYHLPIQDVFRKAFSYHNKHLELNDNYKNVAAETVAYRKNQTCFTVSLKVTSFQENKIQLGFCTAINISDKKEAVHEARYLRNELKNLDQLNNELIANVTHELRTPINGIMGFGNSLLETDLNPEQIEDIKVILRCSTNMNNIVNNILDYTKLANSKLELEHREFNFHDFIQHIIKVNSIQINEKGLELLVNISEGIPEKVIGDELRLSQVLNNLLSNAVKFTSIGHIGLEITKIYERDQTIELFFMLFDTGIGISPEEKDKLFKSFSQVDSSITRIFGGTGLGLSICKRLVEAMGGAIQVDSEKNKGSAFSFSIRLGLPQDGSVFSVANKQNDLEPNRFNEIDDNNELGQSVSEFDYINMRLKRVYETTLQKPRTRETLENVAKAMKSLMEKIVICIEMENWAKAEELVCALKKMVPPEHSEVAKKVFRLLLDVRKENHENSLAILKELNERMFKEG